MAHYLVVAHHIDVAELVGCVGRLVRDDRSAACTLLVTATHWTRPISGHTPTLEALAVARGVAARDALRDAGLFLVGTLAGDGSPAVAFEDELRAHPERYDAVVLCTPRPRGVLGWIEGDLRARVEARVPLPVFHLYAGSPAPWPREARPRVRWWSRLWARTLLTPKPGDNLVPTRRQMVPYFVLMACYLIGGLALAIAVNRGFLLNDFVALCLYTLVIGGLIIALRIEP